MAAHGARALQGKDRPTWTPSERTGAHVGVINGDKPRLHRAQGLWRIYRHYSSYPDAARSTFRSTGARAAGLRDVVTLAVRRDAREDRPGEASAQGRRSTPARRSSTPPRRGRRSPSDRAPPLSHSIITMAVNNPWTWGLGRRKSAVARVRSSPAPAASSTASPSTTTSSPPSRASMRQGRPRFAARTDALRRVLQRRAAAGVATGAVALGLARALKNGQPGHLRGACASCRTAHA